MKMIIDTYRKFWSFLPLYKSNFCLIFISKILGTITSVLIPFFAAGIVRYFTSGDYREALWWIFYFFLASTFKVIFYYFNYYGAANDSQYCYTKLKEKCFEKLSTYDLDFSQKKDVDEILQATSSDIWGITALNDNLSDVIITFVKIVIVVLLISFTSISVGIIVLIVCVFYIILTMFFNQKVVYYLHKQRKYQDKIAGIFIEEMNSMEEMKVYHMEEKYYDHFRDTNRLFSENYRKKRRFADLQSNFLQLLLELGEVSIYLVTLYLLWRGNYTVDTIVLVIGYFSLLMTDLKYMLETCVKNMVNKKISIDRLYDLFNYKPKSVATYGADSTDDIKGVLEFNHIFTSYGDNKVLKDVSFVIKPKELTAIVGRSGSGKSTILNHILRLYTPDSGVISIDGKDIFSYQDDVYKTNVSVVTQKSFLFQMSIRDNLNLVDSNFSRQQEVCKELGIHDEILSLPKGYQTILEENASNVSTRLKQLLSIARSILTNSEILLFDEITSSLDSDTTKQVVKVFKKLSKTHTVILITHKREVMDAADHLIIISKGRKVADGTPSDLKDNFYYNDLKNSKSFDHSYEQENF